MTRKPSLRVAGPDEKAPEFPSAKDLKEAVERSERDVLVTLRAQLASVIDGGVPPHTLAPLTRQLLTVDKEIRLLDLKLQQEAEDDGISPDEVWEPEAL